MSEQDTRAKFIHSLSIKGMNGAQKLASLSISRIYSPVALFVSSLTLLELGQNFAALMDCFPIKWNLEVSNFYHTLYKIQQAFVTKYTYTYTYILYIYVPYMVYMYM